MKIITLPDSRLRQISKEVSIPLSDEDKKIAQEMVDYINESQKEGSQLREGIGIAAVQLGYLKRMFYIKCPVSDGVVYEELLINPNISKRSGVAALEKGEGCLSVEEVENEKEHDGLVHRSQKILITGYSPLKNQVVAYEVDGFLAIVFQHEYDHLEGKLYIDYIDRAKPFEKQKKATYY